MIHSNSNVSKDLTIEEVLENYENDKKMKSIINSVAGLCFESNCSAILANLKAAMESFNENYNGIKIDDDTLSRIIIKAEIHNILPNNKILDDDAEFGKELAHLVNTQLFNENYDMNDFIDSLVRRSIGDRSLEEDFLKYFAANDFSVEDIEQMSRDGLNYDDEEEYPDFIRACLKSWKGEDETKDYFNYVCANRNIENLTIEQALYDYDYKEEATFAIRDTADLIFEGNCDCIAEAIKDAIHGFEENYAGLGWGERFDDNTLSKAIIKAEAYNLLGEHISLFSKGEQFGKELAHFAEKQPLDTKNFTIKDFIDEIVEKKATQEQTNLVRTRR